MTRPVVFVASLAHSGSTLLDLLLSSHERFVGVGELHLLLRAERRWEEEALAIRCACGAAMADCVLWGEVVPQLADRPEAPMAERYRIVLSTFDRVFGVDHTLVDSSKYPQALAALRAAGDLDVRVVQLRRDVRSWTVSMLDTRARRLASGGLTEAGERRMDRRRSAWGLFRQWYRANRALDVALVEAGVATWALGYEELALDPDPMMARLGPFVGIAEHPGSLDLRRSQSHNVLGNRMRLQPERRRAVTYDYQWLSRDEWVAPSIVMRQTMRYNAVAVYPHGRCSTG